jgi:phosphinothricin acetyltransferase
MTAQAPAAAPAGLPVVVAGRVLYIRNATEADVPAITEIFNQGVEDGLATLDPTHTVEQRMAWFQTHGPTEPVLVAEDNGKVVAWASLSKYSPRLCYDSVKELSIYVGRPWRGRGLGGVVMDRLMDTARHAGVHKVILFCLPANKSAVALYHRQGFRDVGVFHHHGHKDGVWHDILVMEIDLAED